MLTDEKLKLCKAFKVELGEIYKIKHKNPQYIDKCFITIASSLEDLLIYLKYYENNNSANVEFIHVDGFFIIRHI